MDLQLLTCCKISFHLRLQLYPVLLNSRFFSLKKSCVCLHLTWELRQIFRGRLGEGRSRISFASARHRFVFARCRLQLILDCLQLKVELEILRILRDRVLMECKHRRVYWAFYCCFS